jgi:hypothetical protein
VLIVACASALIMPLGLLLVAWFLGDSRARLPVPKIGVSVGEAEDKLCKLCGAPIRFAVGALAAQCGYCGGESYRVELGRRAHSVAAGEERSAALSLYDTMMSLRERRRTVLAVLLGVTLVALFVALMFAIVALLGSLFGG